MEKKNKSEKICPCGRIITNPNNKTGLCPKCQKTGINIVTILGIVGIIIKKHGSKVIKGVLTLLKT